VVAELRPRLEIDAPVTATIGQSGPGVYKNFLRVEVGDSADDADADVFADVVRDGRASESQTIRDCALCVAVSLAIEGL